MTPPATAPSRAPGKSILDYYVIACVDSVAAALFLYCAYFWARESFGYSDGRNLLMGAAQGLAAVIAARYGGRLGDRIGYDRLIRLALPALALTLIVGSGLDAAWTPLAASVTYIGILTATWPNVEAAALHAPSRLSMPTRLGLYNVTWSFSGGLGFFLGGWIYAWNPLGILWVPAALHGMLWLYLRVRRNVPAGHTISAMQVPHSGDRISREVKRPFLHAAWIANAAHYFMATAFLALAPQLGERFGLPASRAIWLSCSLLFARGLAFVVFWLWPGWHYRWAWSLCAIALAPACLPAIFFSTSIALVAASFLLFGLATGLTYYTSIYYSLDYGENKGEHGGLHEAILGLGILAGPLAGALGARAFGGARGAQWTVLALAALISVGAATRLWKHERRNAGGNTR